jgi:hypothetical protein
MKKIIFAIMLMVSVSFVYSAELDWYSDYAYRSHPEVYSSIQSMVCDYEKDDIEVAVQMINEQCLNLYICMSAYQNGDLNTKAVEFLRFIYNSSAAMETVNWVVVLEQLSILNKIEIQHYN